MFICGKNYVGGKNSFTFTPTNVTNMEYIELKNGMYDYLYLTQSTTPDIFDEPPTEWDFDTLLFAQFNGNTNAGNIDKAVSETTHLVLKSRKVGDFKWRTLATKEVHSVDDFEFYYNDYFVGDGEETEYAIVPVYYGIEGNYATTTTTPHFGMIFLIEGDKVYGTPITDGFCDVTRNIPSANVELLNSKYPIFVRNSIANYDTGQVTGNFVYVNTDEDVEGCVAPEFNINDDYKRIVYQKEFMDFICDGAPKILKNVDGRKWLIQVTPNPTDNADGVYNNRQITIPWVEIGDINSEEDLYYLGFSDVTSEWWN